MRLSVGFGIALVGLARNLLRSALAMVGLIIGVAAVLTMVALGRGARETVTGEMTSAGTNLVFVRAGNYIRGGDAVNIPSGFGKATTLTEEDADAVAELPHVEYLTPEVDDRASISFSDRKTFSPVLGCGAALPFVYDLTVTEGRFFEPGEVPSGDSVAVLSQAVRDELFAASDDPIGREILIGEGAAEVVGVVETAAAAAHTESVFVPYPNLQQALGIDYVHGITIASEQAGDTSAIAEDVRRLLRERHGLDDPERTPTSPSKAITIRGFFVGDRL